MKESRQLKKARTTETQQTLRDDLAAKKTIAAAEAMSNIASTSAAPKSRPSELSTHTSASLPISSPIADQMSSANDEKWLTFPQAHGHPLLPGLPNDIALVHVVPKLRWRDFYTLSAVSPAWCNAIRSHQIYDERVRSGSTETFVLLCYERKVRRRMVAGVAFYSMEDDSWFELPPIPPVLGGGNPLVSRCVGLDGNVYVMGVDKPRSDGPLVTYVFDLARQRHWRKCAAMGREGYRTYGEYGVLDGKIYMLGGLGKTIRDSRGSNKVYDPVENTWSSIKPMKSLRFGHQVGAMGDKLYVFGGAGSDQFFDSAGKPVAAFSRKSRGYYYSSRGPNTVQIYHPLQDEWRAVVGGPQTSRIREVVFVAQGKFHTLSRLGIHEYDVDAQQFTQLHSVTPELLGPADISWINPNVGEAVGDEILAIVTWHHGCIEKINSEECIIRCKGLGSQNKNLIWERAKTPRFFPTPVGSTVQCMSRIQF